MYQLTPEGLGLRDILLVDTKLQTLPLDLHTYTYIMGNTNAYDSTTTRIHSLAIVKYPETNSSRCGPILYDVSFCEKENYYYNLVAMTRWRPENARLFSASPLQLYIEEFIKYRIPCIFGRSCSDENSLTTDIMAVTQTLNLSKYIDTVSFTSQNYYCYGAISDQKQESDTAITDESIYDRTRSIIH